MTVRGRKPNKTVRMKGITEKAIIAGLVVACTIAVFFCVYAVIKNMGRISLNKHANEVVNAERQDALNDVTLMEDIGEETLELTEGQILVDGEIYEYNKDIMTFLCLGIDTRKGIEGEKTPGQGGQADAILLVVVNPRSEEIQVITVNRDTMVDVEYYDNIGAYIGEEYSQIALQYAYGDGREKSCRLMEEKISDLFYGIPIHGYGALDMQSIATINDAVGGVEVTVLEDMTKFKKDWTKGTKVKLTGSDAERYIARRDTTLDASNVGRIERQKQYLNAYVEQLKKKMKEDITFPITLLNQVKKHSMTSLSVQEITYLADTVLGYRFSTENIISLPGELKLGGKHEEFYVDDAGVKDIVVEVFYEKVEESEERTP